MALIDVWIRTAFRGEEHEPGGFGDAVIQTYPVHAPLTSVRSAIDAGTAAFLVFTDSLINLPARSVRRALQYLLQNPRFAGITLGSEALSTVYGFASSGRAAEVAQSVGVIPELPSWCAIVRRDAFLRASIPSDIETPEFLLMELARDGGPFVRIGSTELSLDTAVWGRDLVVQAGRMLAHDYSHHRARHGDDLTVPPQFRVEMLGETVDPGPLGETATRELFPKLSIVCPIFKPDFVGRMIESVKRQTWQNWELLMIVDGPPPAERAKIEKVLADTCDDPRICFSFQENQGTGPTRSCLGELSTGDFIISVDDDDMLADEALATFASAIRENPGVRFFRGGARVIGLVERELRPRPRLIIDGISNDPFEVTQPFAIDRNLLRELRGFEWDPTLRNAGEDTFLFHKIDHVRAETRIIDRPLYFRRLSTHNLSLQFEPDEAYSHFFNIDRMFCPPEWKMASSYGDLLDGYQWSTTTYRDADGREVVCSTRAFQFRTLGSLSQTTIDLELTSVCNAVCTFCPREVMPDKKRFLAVPLVERLAEQMSRVDPPPNVVFCGIGESTLHPDLVQITKIVGATGAKVSMTTNGGRLTLDLFQRLAEAGMEGFNFSINAATPATHKAMMKLNSYDNLLSMLDQILAWRREHAPKVSVHTSFVVCETNQHEVEQFVEYWRPRDVSSIWLHPLNNRAGLVVDELKPVDLAKWERRYAGDPRVVVDVLRNYESEDDLCKVARSFVFISADGEMRLCAMDYRRQTHYGSLAFSNLEDMHARKLTSFMAGETKSLCEQCDFFPRGNCASRGGTNLDVVYSS
ncbi:MAG TPA: radical SAM protein [Thermoanaerobaculia bacterium]|jgi:MoaA/NifB/PqqE/SkfB family radical SAM enzyme/glycosyltransferase involved in cell wall biosynthesis|nr:radical SAM protein [Thermoanaerobaculia bacterium]